jgi:hypothetical protein
MKTLPTFAGLFLITLLGGFAGAWLKNQLLPEEPRHATPDPALMAALQRELDALRDGSGLKTVPEIVRAYIDERMAEVPFAQRAAIADHALAADYAAEAGQAETATLADTATYAGEAGKALTAQEATLAERATVATQAEQAKAAEAARYAQSAENALEAARADATNNPTNVYLSDFFAAGAVVRRDGDQDRPRPNFRLSAQASAQTRRINIVFDTAIQITLDSERPVYLALVDGTLELGPGSNGEFSILRDQLPIARARFANPSEREALSIPAGALNTIDLPPNGSHQYVLQLQANDGTIAVRSVQLIAIAL